MNLAISKQHGLSSLYSSFIGYSLLFLLATIPLQWIVLFKFLNLALRPTQIILFVTFSLIFFYLVVFNKKIYDLKNVIGIFIGFYAFYLMTLIFALFWTQDLKSGVSIIIKYSTYFLSFLVIVQLILLLPDYKRAYFFSIAIPIGIFLFCGIVSYIYIDLGRNILTDYAASILAGDEKAVQYGFYPTIFNYSFTGVARRETDEYISNSLRNTMVGGFILYYIVLKMYKNFSIPGFFNNYFFIIVKKISIFLSFLLVILSLSRSNMIILFFAIMFSYLLSVLKPRVIKITKTQFRKYMMVTALIALLIPTVTFLIKDYLLNSYKMIESRFEDLGHDSRIGMYENALKEIGNNIIIGKGLGVEIEGSEGKASGRVHNFFLSSWVEAGIFGFIGSLLTYFSIVLIWFFYTFNILIEKRTWELNTSFEWTMTLPIIPLFRCLVSGGGGALTSIEWFCLSLFFACLYRNEYLFWTNKKLIKQHN